MTPKVSLAPEPPHTALNPVLESTQLVQLNELSDKVHCCYVTVNKDTLQNCSRRLSVGGMVLIFFGLALVGIGRSKESLITAFVIMTLGASMTVGPCLTNAIIACKLESPPMDPNI